MGLFDMFSSKPPPPKGGLLQTPAQPAEPSMQDKWRAYAQDHMEQGLPGKPLPYDQWLKQQQTQPAPVAPK